MKVKLLKKLRRVGRNKININSVTTENDIVVGMSIGFDEDEYSGLFNLGDTEEMVRENASRIYIKSNIDYIRRRYKK